MPVLDETELMQNLDFQCARCQAECTKVNAAEPTLGYISKVDGTFVGPLCKNCWDQIPAEERKMNKIPATAFLVLVQQDGEGAVMTTENIPLVYLREPTYNDVLDACDQIGRDIHDAIFTQKLMGNLLRVLGAKPQQSKLIVPR
jgi:hypothetical protein